MERFASVIIATTAASSRQEGLARAVASVLTQDLPATVIVVANGCGWQTDFSPFGWDRRVQILRLSEPSYPAAVKAGLERVDTPFFTVLDDDDALLPGALRLRWLAMEQAEKLDFVGTNGTFTTGEPVLNLNAEAVNADPLGTNIRQNWLVSGGGLYRTEAVRPVFFDIPSKYCEWTTLTYSLLLNGLRGAFLPASTFVRSDTPESLSKQPATIQVPHIIDSLEAIEPRIPALYLPQFQAKLASAYHEMADAEYQNGRWAAAWQAHWRSIETGGNLQHAPFLFRLLVACLRGSAQSAAGWLIAPLFR